MTAADRQAALVTDADRERAEGLLTDDIAVGWDGSGWHEARNAIAQALADERERARAPFLALAEDYAQETPELPEMWIFRNVARDLRRVAEDQT